MRGAAPKQPKRRHKHASPTRHPPGRFTSAQLASSPILLSYRNARRVSAPPLPLGRPSRRSTDTTSTGVTRQLTQRAPNEASRDPPDTRSQHLHNGKTPPDALKQRPLYSLRQHTTEWHQESLTYLPRRLRITTPEKAVGLLFMGTSTTSQSSSTTTQAC